MGVLGFPYSGRKLNGGMNQTTVLLMRRLSRRPHMDKSASFIVQQTRYNRQKMAMDGSRCADGRYSIFREQGGSWVTSVIAHVKKDQVYIASINHVLLELFTTGNPSYLEVTKLDGSDVITEVKAGQVSSSVDIRGKKFTFGYAADFSTITIAASASSTMYVFGV